MDQKNDPTPPVHYTLDGTMVGVRAARVCIRFLKRHLILLIIAAVGILYIAGAVVIWNAIEQIQEDKEIACSNAELRANALHNILVGVLSRTSDTNSPGYIFFQEELNKLPLVHCVDGKLLPVGENKGEDIGSGT